MIVPWMTDPFLSSIVTVSLLSFIKNLVVSYRAERGSSPDELHFERRSRMEVVSVRTFERCRLWKSWC